MATMSYHPKKLQMLIALVALGVTTLFTEVSSQPQRSPPSYGSVTGSSSSIDDDHYESSVLEYPSDTRSRRHPSVQRQDPIYNATAGGQQLLDSIRSQRQQDVPMRTQAPIYEAFGGDQHPQSPRRPQSPQHPQSRQHPRRQLQATLKSFPKMIVPEVFMVSAPLRMLHSSGMNSLGA
eukprot:Lankesteria_metandrocarpae@DN4013_c1_g1_i3.p1